MLMCLRGQTHRFVILTSGHAQNKAIQLHIWATIKKPARRTKQRLTDTNECTTHIHTSRRGLDISGAVPDLDTLLHNQLEVMD